MSDDFVRVAVRGRAAASPLVLWPALTLSEPKGTITHKIDDLRKHN